MNAKEWPIVYLFRKLWEHSKGNRLQLVLYNLMSIVAQTLHALNPLIIALLLNTIQSEGVNEANVWKLIGIISLLLLTELGYRLLFPISRVMEARNSFIVDKNYRLHLLRGVLFLPVKWHTDNHSGDTIDKINRATSALTSFASSTYVFIYAVMNAIIAYVALSFFEVRTLIIVIIITFLAGLTIWSYDKKLVPQYKKLNKMSNGISAKIYDTISNVTTIIILRIRHATLKILQKKIDEPYELTVKNQKLNELKWSIVNILVVFLTVGVVSLYLLLAVKNETLVLVGTISALIAYVGNVSHSFFNFAYSYSQFIRGKTDIMQAEEIEKEFTHLSKYKQTPLKNWKEITVENLNFSYEDITEDKHTNKKKKETLHLENVHLKIQQKQKIALIGESGSGKTTALKIIRELYEPKDSTVKLDGKVLENGFASISSSIALIPQDPEIFNSSIRDNITIGVTKPLATIRKYAKLAKFDAVAMKLPNQYKSSIQEKGVNLSGGEKQRLALTRGLLASKDKEIILLDEPTSSVDMQNELDIFKNIFKLYKQKTVIASVHRLHLLPLFDQIYFFKNGKIIAHGSYKELQQTSKPFQTLLRKYKKASEEKSV